MHFIAFKVYTRDAIFSAFSRIFSHFSLFSSIFPPFPAFPGPHFPQFFRIFRHFSGFCVHFRTPLFNHSCPTRSILRVTLVPSGDSKSGPGREAPNLPYSPVGNRGIPRDRPTRWMSAMEELKSQDIPQTAELSQPAQHNPIVRIQPFSVTQVLAAFRYTAFRLRLLAMHGYRRQVASRTRYCLVWHII